MSKYVPPASKIIGGKRYAIATVDDSKAMADKRARQLRRQGQSVRVVKIPKAPKGKAGYTMTRWAIYFR